MKRPYSSNTEIQRTIEWLQSIGCPPIAVAPKQDPRSPNAHHVTYEEIGYKAGKSRPEIQGDYCRISNTKVDNELAPVKGRYCRLDENLNPIGRFTGKNPGYVDASGIPRSILHHEYQKRMPTDEELYRWFANPVNGVGTLGGHNGVDWLDFDAKNYGSQEECDRDVARIRALVGSTHVEKTGSGGWRIAVKPKTHPTFTNFTTNPSGDGHIGEALWQGRFTVLAPSIHPNGNPYIVVEDAPIAEIESLEAIGIYATKDEQANQERREQRKKSGQELPVTNPADNSDDIRNLAEYLDGYRIDGDYIECRCPAHSGQTDNSLSIHIETGGFWCWAGCDKSTIYKKVMEIAIASGYKFPEPGEPNSIEYQQFVEREQEQERCEDAEADRRILERLTGWLNRSRRRLGKKGNGFQQSETPTQSRQPLEYESEEELTSFINKARHEGKYILDTSVTGSGKSHMYGGLTNTQLGVAETNPDSEEKQGRVWWIDKNHANPTTLPVEQSFDDLPVRNSGMKLDPSRPTPRGLPQKRHPKKNEKPDTPGNCHLADAFHMGQERNVSFASDAATANPICLSCKHFAYCGQSKGNGYGFRYERKEVFANSTRIRASFDSLPSPDDGNYSSEAILIEEALPQLKPVKTITASQSDFDSQWAELEQISPDQYELLRPVRLALRQFVCGKHQQFRGLDDRQIRELIGVLTEGVDIALIAQKMRVSFQSLFGDNLPDGVDSSELSKETSSIKGKIKRRQEKLAAKEEELAELRSKPAPRAYNHRTAQVFDRLAKLPEEIAALKTEIEQLKQELDLLNKYKASAKAYSRSQYQKAATNILEKIENTSNQWLVPFLQVWAGIKKGALRIGAFGNLTVTIEDQRQREIIASAGLVIFLDATATPEILALHAGLDPDKVLWIRRKMPTTDNLEVIQVRGFGLAGKKRAESTDERLRTLIKPLGERHDRLTVFDHLTKRDATGADGWHFGNDTRGSNRFENHSAIVSIGLPLPDVGVFYDRWVALGGEATGIEFARYYKSFVDAEIIQEVGRLRAVRRLEEKLTAYFVFDTDRANFDYELPASLNPVVKDVAEICIEAAPLKQKVWHYVEAIIKDCFSDRKLIPTQEQVAARVRELHPEILRDDDAKKISVTRAWISKLADEFAGGWKQLKKLFHTLLTTPSAEHSEKIGESLPLPPEQEPEIEFYASHVMPAIQDLPGLNIVWELKLIIKSLGWCGFRHVVSRTPYNTRLALVNGLFNQSDPLDKFEL
ncbi:MAG: hypothetical protein Kow00121_36720 [Elainellaceae cyanobacterium]